MIMLSLPGQMLRLKNDIPFAMARSHDVDDVGSDITSPFLDNDVWEKLACVYP